MDERAKKDTPKKLHGAKLEQSRNFVMYAYSSISFFFGQDVVWMCTGGIRFSTISHIRRDMACTECGGKTRVLCSRKREAFEKGLGSSAKNISNTELNTPVGGPMPTKSTGHSNSSSRICEQLHVVEKSLLLLPLTYWLLRPKRRDTQS